MRIGIVLLALLGVFCVLPADAQDSSFEMPMPPESTVPPELQGMVGAWVLEQEDPGLPRCPLALTDAEAIGGWAVELAAPCPAPYPPAESMLAWNVDTTDGSVIFLDAERHVTLRLFEDEDGLYDTAEETPPRLYLLPPYDEDDSAGEADE